MVVKFTSPFQGRTSPFQSTYLPAPSYAPTPGPSSNPYGTGYAPMAGGHPDPYGTGTTTGSMGSGFAPPQTSIAPPVAANPGISNRFITPGGVSSTGQVNPAMVTPGIQSGGWGNQGGGQLPYMADPNTGQNMTLQMMKGNASGQVPIRSWSGKPKTGRVALMQALRGQRGRGRAFGGQALPGANSKWAGKNVARMPIVKDAI